VAPSTTIDALGRAFAGGRIGMALIDLDGHWLEVNPALCRMLGRPADEMLGRSLYEVTHPEDLPACHDRMRVLGAGGRSEPMMYEQRYVRSDGSTLWARVMASVALDDTGRPQTILSHIEDVTEGRLVRDHLREAEQRFRSAFDHASVGMALLSIDGRVLRANAALGEMLGHPTGDRWLVASVHPDDLEEGHRLVRDVLRGVTSRYAHQPRMIRADGATLMTRVTGSVVRDADGHPLHLVIQVEDITATRTAEQVAQRRLAQQTAVAQLGQQALDEPDLKALLEAAVATAAATLDVSIGSLLRLAVDGDTVEVAAGVGWDVSCCPFSLRETPGLAAAVFSGSGPLVVEDMEAETRFESVCLRRHEIASCAVMPVIGEDDTVHGALGVFSRERRAFTTDDIAFLTSLANVVTGAVHRDAAARRLRHQSLHDPLTQLPNRSLLIDRLRHGIARARRDGSTLAVLFCDLDDFKYVNDSLGHHTGDRLLATLAGRLKDALRDADTLGRFGGDEFVVLCEGLRDAGEATQVAQRLMEVCARPVDLGDIEYISTTSIGIAIAPPGSDPEPEALLRDADVAMYGAKRRGKGRYEIFDTQMRAGTTNRIALTGELRRAIAGGELELHYQPIVALRHHEVVCAEALVRWRHPVRGLLPPAEFVVLAEDSGLIHDLGRWVVDEAIGSAARWRREGTPILDHVTVGVNVSWRQLTQGTLIEDVYAALERHGVDGSVLCAEVTESALVEEPRRARAALADLRAMGVHLALDDFGTGHSSLSVLRDCDLDTIKVDRSFLAGAGEWAIIRAIRAMADSLGLRVVAEGVERDDQAACLEEIGCDYGQGWLYCHPTPADALPQRAVELDELLRARR